LLFKPEISEKKNVFIFTVTFSVKSINFKKGKNMYSFGASLCRKKMAKAKMKRKDSFVDWAFDEKSGCDPFL